MPLSGSEKRGGPWESHNAGQTGGAMVLQLGTVVPGCDGLPDAMVGLGTASGKEDLGLLRFTYRY